MNKRQLADIIGQAIRDLELAEQRILELEAEVARLKAMLPSPDWDNAPDNAEWHAVDSGGRGFWYSGSNPPMILRNSVWVRAEDGDVAGINNHIMLHYAPRSLQRRPQRGSGDE